jgi:hypothetical protein
VHTFPQEQPNKGSVIMSGALNATTNQVSWLYSGAKDTQAMIDLVEILFNQHPFTSRIYLTWDAASWHKSGSLVDWLDAFNVETASTGFGPTIHLVPLPSRNRRLRSATIYGHSDSPSRSSATAAMATT